jgi:hypothetical protein
MSASRLKRNRNALKGLKVSNIGEDKEALQEVFRHALNKARSFY